MQHEYIDSEGVQWDIDIYTSLEDGEVVYTVHRNGGQYLDLVIDEDGKWIERFGGPSQRSEEYGKLIDSLGMR